MTIWNGITEQGAVVPIQVDDQGRVVVSGGGGLPSQVYGTAKAVGLFNSDGSTVFAMGCSATYDRTGVYLITFDTPFPDTDYIAVATGASGQNRICSMGLRQTGSAEIEVVNVDGTPTTTSLSVAFFDARPTDVTPLILPTSTVLEVQSLRSELDQLKKNKNL